VAELKLESEDLHDDPTFIISAIVSYVKSKSYSVKKMEKREKEIRASGETLIEKHIGGWRRFIFNWVLKQTRRAVKNRENLRFDRTKIFGIARHLFRAMGGHFEKMGVLAEERDIFYLTVEEIRGYIEGRGLETNLKNIALQRKNEYKHFENSPPPPDRFLTYGAASASALYPSIMEDADLLRGERKISDDPNVLLGTPCCPGVVEGIVLVAEDIKDTEGLDGQILVTSRTDPGWVPLYPSCTGLLIERGSLLSHSAVVARELGLPTIVGVDGGLMERLQTGMKVKVDAGKGEIRILENDS
jgi:pyruvate,water dikinase